MRLNKDDFQLGVDLTSRGWEFAEVSGTELYFRATVDMPWGYGLEITFSPSANSVGCNGVYAAAGNDDPFRMTPEWAKSLIIQEVQKRWK